MRETRPSPRLALIALCASISCSPVSCDPRRANSDYCGLNGTCPDGFLVDMSVDDLGHPPAGCKDSSTCPPSAPVCSGGKCGGCTGVDDGGMSAECATYHVSTTPPTPLCGPLGTCVQCLSSSDCAQFNQACKLATNTCGSCAIHGDCATGVCKTGGACASASEVYYVDNRGAASIAACKTAHPTADGTSWTTAYCDIADALSSPSPRPYVLVMGRATAYGSITITSNAGVTIIGPGHNATPTALVTPIGAVTATPALLVSTINSPATVTVDGLELVGTGSAIPAAGVKCQVGTGAATLKVLNSYVHSSGGYGVESASCALTLDGNIIGPSNIGGGISINGGSANASNNLVVGNGTAGFGVLFNGSVSGTWWFNTVADNKRTGTSAAAFNCSAATAVPAIQASIIWGNDKDATGSSIGTGCNLTYVDIDDTTTPTGTGNVKTNPMLTSGTLPGTGYRLPAAFASCEITSATGLTGGALPNHDVDGNARPRPSTSGYDCGGSQGPAQ